VGKLARSIERPRNARHMPALMGRTGQRSVRIRFFPLVMTARLAECGCTVQEFGFSNDPLSSDRRSTVTGSI